MNYTCIDVETANADFASICQIGIVRFVDGQPADTWSTLVDPEDHFDAMNVWVHGIDEAAVVGAPKFPELVEQLAGHFADTVLVCHTHFDRSAMAAVYRKHSLMAPAMKWLDSARVVRRAWEQFARSGYGLGNVAEFLGIDFQHHDAKEDAYAAGMILARAIQETGISLVEWLERVELPIMPRGWQPTERIAREGNPEGPLFGEVLVFTGKLNLVRRQAADLAALAGCEVAPSVTKKTTLLVVGDQDVRLLNGKDKSEKHLKAEDLIRKGQPIRILMESDFERIVKGVG